MTDRRYRLSPAERADREIKTNELIKKFNLDRPVALRFVSLNSDLSFDQLCDTVMELLDSIENIYRSMFCSSIPEDIKTLTINKCVYRIASRKKITNKQISITLSGVIDLVNYQKLQSIPAHTKYLRNQLLAQVREIIDCESNKGVESRLNFIVQLFTDIGLSIPRKIVSERCSKSGLFSSRRVSDSEIETLRTAYGLIGYHGLEIFINPDYLLLHTQELKIPKKIPVVFHREFRDRGSQGKCAGHSVG